jgi:hypothetical protein
MTTAEGLAALKIDRTRKRAGWKVWPIFAVALLILAILAAPKMMRQWQGVEVTVATVKQVGGLSGVTASGAAPLSAAGYIVADRQSCWLSKAPGGWRN